jgi:hypothetical protein
MKSEEREMACELLQTGSRIRCLAVEGELIPSHHERERYCYGDFSRCPTGRLYRLRARPLAQEQYWALWIPEAAEPASDGGLTALV